MLIEGDQFVEEIVLGVDAHPVKTEPLINEYNNFNCKDFAGKPKIFIIFSCRGDKDQVVMRSHATPSSSMPHQPTQMGNRVISAVGDDDTKSAMEDFLILRSTVIDFISYFSEYIINNLIFRLILMYIGYQLLEMGRPLLHICVGRSYPSTTKKICTFQKRRRKISLASFTPTSFL